MSTTETALTEQDMARVTRLFEEMKRAREIAEGDRQTILDMTLTFVLEDAQCDQIRRASQMLFSIFCRGVMERQAEGGKTYCTVRYWLLATGSTLTSSNGPENLRESFIAEQKKLKDSLTLLQDQDLIFGGWDSESPLDLSFYPDERVRYDILVRESERSSFFKKKLASKMATMARELVSKTSLD